MVVFRRVVLEVRELHSGAILAKSVYDNGMTVYARNVYGDPAAYGAPDVVTGNDVAVDSRPWWCDYGARGKLVDANLCQPAQIVQRRAIALNPWSSSAPSDLDTIIDSNGYHKSGTIGRSPFTFTRSTTPTDATILATFVAASDATIASIWLLAASNASPSYASSCSRSLPSAANQCCTISGLNCFASIYMALWYWDVSISVRAGIPYSVKITFSTKTSS